MRDEQRTRVWVDEFQTRLTRRIVAYLILTLVVMINLLFAWRLLAEGVNDLGGQFLGVLRDNLPAIVCLLVLVPVMGWDAVRFTHRLVGPLARFRAAMRAVAEGEPVGPIRLREGDQLTDLRDDFNQMLDALQSRGAVPRPAAPGEGEGGSAGQDVALTAAPGTGAGGAVMQQHPARVAPRRRRGATAMEYLFMASLILIAAITAIGYFGDATKGSLEKSSNSINKATTGK